MCRVVQFNSFFIQDWFPGDSQIKLTEVIFRNFERKRYQKLKKIPATVADINFYPLKVQLVVPIGIIIFSSLIP